MSLCRGLPATASVAEARRLSKSDPRRDLHQPGKVLLRNRQLSEPCVGVRRIGPSEHRRVRRIERLAAKLKGVPLGDMERPRDRHVDVAPPGIAYPGKAVAGIAQ